MAEPRKFMFDVDFSAEVEAGDRPARMPSDTGLSTTLEGEFNLGLDDRALEEVEFDGGELTASELAALKEMSEAPDDEVHVDIELAVAHEPEPEPEPPPPTFSEEEMNVSRQLAFQEGHQIGLSEAAEAADTKTAAALETLAANFGQVFQAQAKAQDDNARNAVRVAMSVVRKLFPASSAQFAEAEIAHTVAEVIGQILDEPRIIVRVAPTLETVLKSRLEQVASDRGFEGRVVVQGDARVAAGDCRIEWTDGGAERDQARLMTEIEALVERSLTPPSVAADGDVAETGEDTGNPG